MAGDLIIATGAQENLWCLHVLGPDSVIPMPDKATAEREAAKVNEFAEVWKNRPDADPVTDPQMGGEAMVWPWEAERHAGMLPSVIEAMKHNRLEWV
jgi:hypothetical protein